MYQLDLSNLSEKKIFDLDSNFTGSNLDGDEISFTNFYMKKNGAPFFGLSGEFHFSRMSDTRWEDELVKMKMGGINVIATYVFWIHHEEEEGVFDFSGRRNLRKFIELCEKYGLYVILRVGPFDHGEVRNGGLPDWMYGKPFEVRQLNEGFIQYTKKLYTKISEEISGLFYKDNGPIIGVQIDNEYMHSSAPWELTVGTSEEWVFGGNEGNTYMLYMRDLAAECGLIPVFYTCTGWGGAATPDSMMPLWGGYAFRPWLFYSFKGEHPSTEEYVYQDFHKNDYVCNYDFKPAYSPEDKPYACCEMGGGMTCSYYYRFQYPFKSVDAMANIKLASGCNFLGYYMFQGGSNPVGKNGLYMNEGQVPKISYDYQAALGEFGQVRESYKRLKCIHFFAEEFAEELCGLQTVLPEGASFIDPKDTSILRYAVRTNGTNGFVFINNYQDHIETKEKKSESLTLHLAQEDIAFADISLAADENCILPFHLNMEGIDLVMATAQAVTRLCVNDMTTYVFLIPDKMKGHFAFESGVRINQEDRNTYDCDQQTEAESFIVTKDGLSVQVLCISKEFASQMYIVDGKLIFTDSALLQKDGKLFIETNSHQNQIMTYPQDSFSGMNQMKKTGTVNDILGLYTLETEAYSNEVTVELVAQNRYLIQLPQNFMKGVKDTLLQIHYTGDIGHAFINGEMINDNFYNGAVWEIGLKDFSEAVEANGITIYITPLKEGVNVNVDSPMAARKEEVDKIIGSLESAKLIPVYEIEIN